VRSLVVLALLTAGVIGVRAAAQSGPAPASSDQTAPSQVVRIDVLATDARGRALDTLKPADFEVRDDGVARPLDDVRLVRPSPDDARVIAIFLDEYHVSAGATERIRA